ncbi:hypothetical protein R1sor_009202 [Riccia sorocarpa]|uniref:Phospholipid-transporting ATPase n=1 Tax=Riccia sorocarpa TaxID=122646 RepID=A0ABD3H531_9MARC
MEIPSLKKRAIKLLFREKGLENRGCNLGSDRTIHCNQRSANSVYRFSNNRTSTTKYKWYSFLPGSLFIQYRRSAYWYFTAMAVLSLTPFSPYGAVSVVLPLVFVLALGIGREGWEDFRRSKGDKIVNSRPVQAYNDEGKKEQLQWRELHVGDVVTVSDGDYFPADLLLLSSSGPDGICYVETKNLDGETNLKVRQALEFTWNLKDDASLKEFRADVKCEGPNASLYTFTGRLEFDDGKKFSLDPSQLLLRDSTLQNTGHVWGVVIYAGHDTKVMQNATAPSSKRSRIDRTLDKIIWVMFGTLFVMSFVTGLVLGYRTRHSGPSIWYLEPVPSNPYYNPNKAVVAGIVSAVTGLVLYGYLIPIALYVSLEIVRVLQGLFMMQDLNLYDSSTDKPMRVKSTGLNEELGQVDTILSDKTGTLTCNQMDFFRCTIAGVTYGKGTTEVEKAAQRLGVPVGGNVDPRGEVEESEDRGSAASNADQEKGFNFYDPRLLAGNWTREPNKEVVQLFFRTLALCHTVIPEGKVEDFGSLKYRAESPDEAALVVAAKNFGFCFYKRSPSAVQVREDTGNGEYIDITYELLNVLEFSSARKRMSVILRFPDGRLILLSKGADSVILGRVDPSRKEFVRSTVEHLNQFGEVGLRTLVLAYRELGEQEYQDWQVKYAEARSIVGPGREPQIEKLDEQIEQKLIVIGGTGVEDKLQEGVPESIDRLARAGINLWVLTGDKVETAINIAYACGLLRKGMQKIIISLEGAQTQAVQERPEDLLTPAQLDEALTSRVAQQLAEGLEELLRTKRENGTKIRGASLSKSDHCRASVILHSREFSRSHLWGFFSTLVRSLKIRSVISRKQRIVEQELQEYGTSGLWHMPENSERSLSPEEVSTVRTGRQNGDHPISGILVDEHGDMEFALVVDGHSLALVLEEEKLQEQFIEVCKRCASVLCCRVSPRQKSQVTRLVKKGMGQNRLCLSIGDGANDVGMIQAANVGIGISGVEGAQAAMAADYAIGQFRFLERLLLVHGHWCYRRISIMILYFFYKVSIMGWIAFYCNIFAFFSGQPLYNDWYASFYNTVFTSLPICVVGTIDQDVSADDCVKHPELYRGGHRKELFNRKLITAWLLNSVYVSLVIFFFPLGLFYLDPFRSGGEVASLQEFGAALFTCLVLVPNIQLIAAINYFTWIHHFAMWGSVAVWYLFLLIYGALPSAYATLAYKQLMEALGPSPSYWLLQLLVVVVALLPYFVYRCFKVIVRPSDHQIVLEVKSRPEG